MSIVHRLAWIGALSIAGCATTSSQQLAYNLSAGKSCQTLQNADQRVQKWLTAHNIQRVEPAFHEVPHFAGSSRMFVDGAEIYIIADADTHAAYVERTLSCYAASPSAQAQTHDPFRVEGIRSISAQSTGPTIRVSVRGIDREAGEEIWKRAQSLRSGVYVQQLGAAGHAPGL